MIVTDKEVRERILSTVLGHYTTECQPPEDYDTMSHDEWHEWLESHAWQPFEYWSGSDVAEVIASACDSQWRMMVHFGLVEGGWDDDVT